MGIATQFVSFGGHFSGISLERNRHAKSLFHILILNVVSLANRAEPVRPSTSKPSLSGMVLEIFSLSSPVGSGNV